MWNFRFFLFFTEQVVEGSGGRLKTPSAIRWAQLGAPPFYWDLYQWKPGPSQRYPRWRGILDTPLFSTLKWLAGKFSEIHLHSCWIFQPVMFAFGVYHSNTSKISKIGRKKTCTIHDCELPSKPQSYQDVYVGVDVDTYTLCVGL